MVRHCKTKLSEKDNEGIFIAKFRDKNDIMKPDLEHYDRLPDDHHDGVGHGHHNGPDAAGVSKPEKNRESFKFEIYLNWRRHALFIPSTMHPCQTYKTHIILLILVDQP